jgi:uncharacterized repeat protein (TIGR01451 family)
MDTVEFSELARQKEEVKPGLRQPAPWRARGRGSQHPLIDSSAAPSQDPAAAIASDTTSASSFTAASVPPSPAVSASFVGLLDDGTRFNPDTQGAVGPNHIMTTVQSGVRIHNRSGVPISTVSLNAFWATIVNSTVYDPRVLFDPYGQRWIHTASTDPVGNNPGLLVAVSVTSDPTGAWRRYLVDTHSGEPVFADSPVVGLTKDWITVQAKLFRQDTFAFSRAGIWVLNKTNFYAGGTGRFTFFTYTVPGLGPANAPVPAVNYDETYRTNFFVANWRGNFEGLGFLRMFSVSGPIGAEVFNDYGTNGLYVDNFPVGNPPWDDYSPNDDNFAPQLGSTARIYAGDARIQNVVFRNGTLWCTHTVFLLNSGPQRSAVQWWEISQGSRVLQRGRLDDPAGVNFYAYPSIAVNSLNDALLGYSRFSASQYPSANYAFHGRFDGPGNLRADTVLKAGEGQWDVADAGRVRWGDWSGTVIEPFNDVDFWTIQQYAAAPAGSEARWGTWWSRIGSPVNLSVNMTTSPASIAPGASVTYTIRTTNNIALATSGAKITDTLPADAGFVSATTSLGSCGHTNGIVVCDFGTLPANGSATVTIVAALSRPGQNINRVIVAGSGPDVSPTDDEATVTTSVVPAVDVFPLVAAIPNPPMLNRDFTVAVTVTNRGSSAATAVVLTNTLPVGATFVSLSTSQGTCTRNGNVVNCSLGTLASMSAVNVSFLLTASSTAWLTNRATVTTTALDAVPGNNSTSLVTRADMPPIVSPPLISDISNQTTNEDMVLGPVPFTVNDIDTPTSNLVVTAISSNPALIPNGNIILSGSGTDRRVTITPATNQSGSAMITITVSDGALTTNDTFVVAINAVNDPPGISGLADATIPSGTSTPFQFMISDSDTPPGDLQVTAASSDPVLIPPGNLQLSGTGPERTLMIRSAPGLTGTSRITLTVNDGVLLNTKSFDVLVSSNLPGPVLRITLVGTNAAVSWPTNGTAGWVLQTNPTAGASIAWTNAGLLPSVADDRYQVMFPATGPARFFRLCRDCNGLTPPRLSILASGGNVIVSWIAAQQTFVLESRSSLDGGSLPLETAYVTGKGLGTLRNDYSGFVGMRIGIGASPITVTALGRIFVAGNSSTHIIKLVNAANGTDVAGGTVSLTMSGGTAGQFKYVPLSSPVVLAAGATYYVASQETAGGDFWHNYDTTVTTTSVATQLSAVYGPGVGAWTPYGSAGRMFVPVDFKYSSGSPPPETAYVTGKTLGTVRNDYTGFVGMKVGVGASPITVTALGRMFVAGNSGTHIIKLVNAANGTDVAGGSVSLTMSGGTAGQFKYANLSSPVVLAAGATYYVASQETAGADFWHSYNTTVTTTSVATKLSAVYGPGGAVWTSIGSAGQTFVPVDFKYSNGSAWAPAPEQPAFSDGKNTVTVSASGPTRFFRLRSQ